MNSYIACDWLVREHEVGAFSTLIEVVRNISEDLHLTDKVTVSGEGYLIRTLIVYSTSDTILNQFIDTARERTIFTDWYQIPLDEYPDVSKGWESEETPWWIIHPYLDMLWSHGIHNDDLFEKLRPEKTAYFACNWLVPATLPTGWFEAILQACWDLDCQVRRGKVKQTKTGFHLQTMAIQVYPKETLKKFVEQIGENLGLNDWYPINKEEFIESALIAPFETGEDFELLIEKMSRANAESRA